MIHDSFLPQANLSYRQGSGWATWCLRAELPGLQQGCMIQQGCMKYRKNPKILNTRKFALITLKVEQDDFSLE